MCAYRIEVAKLAIPYRIRAHEALSSMIGQMVFAAAVLLFAYIGPGNAQNSYGATPSNIRFYLDKLVKSYPDWIAGYDHKFLFLKNGVSFQLSDHRSDKTFDQLIEHPDLDDMFYVPYPAGTEPRQPAVNFDPGRVRFQPLFVTMYGDCTKGQVGPKLRKIDWMPAHHGGQVLVTTINGVDIALEEVSRELDKLPAHFSQFLKPGGTYNCRTVAGSQVRSMHAYAAAIDLSPKYSNYWRWSKSREDPIWKNQFPMEIVRIFEKHGFIWGGYWYHFDTMHFEYRPELLGLGGNRGALAR
jgi:D-alanyl-D-alanine carboxypeptidase